MGFKADLSFLSKLTMGATATRAAITYLREMGFSPIELERCSTSNKIWTTKVKRLRLSDLLCIQTGLRVEVRGKSKLEIKMSDAPNNAERRWDYGARDEDLVALVPCRTEGARTVVRGKPTFMTIRAMRAAVETSRLGPPKAASEGAERDRLWPATVPGDDGTVISVDGNKIKTALRSGRTQTYNITGKTAYVRAGDAFTGEASLIAGPLPDLADLAHYRQRPWDPVALLAAETATDRYAAAKALAFRTDVRDAKRLLEAALAKETEQRTALEIAGAAARLGSAKGMAHLQAAIAGSVAGAPDYLPMEAVFIMSELPASSSADLLTDIAGRNALRGNEVRQAAAWGLGKTGCKAYARLVPFLADDEDDFLMHVIAAFGEDTAVPVVRSMVDALVAADTDRKRASVMSALVQIGSASVASELFARATTSLNPWLVAVLGRLPRSATASLAMPRTIEDAIAPVRTLSAEHNWLAETTADTNFQFLVQQNL